MIFLKFGGSLITEKGQPETPRSEVIHWLSEDLAAAKREQPNLRVLLGHGSGSYGHVLAAKFNTHLGASTQAEWFGFAAVWASANKLHRLLIDALRENGLPAMSFPPSSSVVCEGGMIVEMAFEPIQRALEAGLLPVVQGDVAFDRRRGATIVSTEEVMSHLAKRLRPARWLLVGIEPGVYVNYPVSEEIADEISEADLERLSLRGASTTDVTGGMAEKVRQALWLSKSYPDLEIRIFSAEAPGRLLAALRGGQFGTRVRA